MTKTEIGYLKQSLQNGMAVNKLDSTWKKGFAEFKSITGKELNINRIGSYQEIINILTIK